MALKIYTKTGDGGMTSLIGGTKVPKSNIRIDSYGTVDELNSFVGLLSDLLPEAAERSLLKEIQDRLFTIGASLACDPAKDIALKIPDLHAADVSLLEKEIDRMNGFLPAMKSFILPGGHPAISNAHICRCVCRRAERICVELAEAEGIEALILVYLNRLSDYFFVLARFVAHQLQVPELSWKPRV